LAVSQNGHLQLGIRQGAPFIQRRGQHGLRPHQARVEFAGVRRHGLALDRDDGVAHLQAASLSGAVGPHVHHDDGRRPVLQTPGSGEHAERKIMDLAVLAVREFWRVVGVGRLPKGGTADDEDEGDGDAQVSANTCHDMLFV